ncbi:MAG: Type 1 glutamine amidotransferase-like domain-containing protein [Candidatus Dojkabacteria bacterium]|nr:Type 1 glutamine amidotransferase-like domain-containing protein [Candidatus Dojkabacteria bacterium]
MKLFLASQMKHESSIEGLRNFIGGSFDNKTITYVVTAANGESYGAWKESKTLEKVRNLGAKLKVIELENISNYDELKKEINEPDILWFCGGYSGYLNFWLHRTEMIKYIPELLENGTVYVGSSAGACVASRTQYSAGWYLEAPEYGAEFLPGIGLIDFELYPHFTGEKYNEINKHWREGDGKLALMKDDQHFIIDNGAVVSNSEVRFLEK